jgi:hypothetical protein
MACTGGLILPTDCVTTVSRTAFVTTRAFAGVACTARTSSTAVSVKDTAAQSPLCLHAYTSAALQAATSTGNAADGKTYNELFKIMCMKFMTRQTCNEPRLTKLSCDFGLNAATTQPGWSSADSGIFERDTTSQVGC